MAATDPINTLVYDSALCIGCGMCVTVCPHAVFAMNERVVHLVRADDCMECGACQRNCPSGAIAVDSGVGCADALIREALTGKPATCGGDDGTSCCSSGPAEPTCSSDASCSSGGNSSCCG